MYDIDKVRKDFPILKRKIHGKKLVYLDNGASAMKPQAVIDAITDFYENHYANIHRGIHLLSEESTERYEKAREKLAGFINSGFKETIFVRNSTEGLNLVMYAWGMRNVRKGDKIVTTEMEHHSNLVPWMMLAREKGARLEYMEVDEEGMLKEGETEKIRGAKLVAITHISNVTGVINDVESVCRIAAEEGAVSIVDGSQSAPHMPVDVKKIGCDFFALTGHKMCGPTGIGVLYGKEDILERMEPFMYGGDMLQEAHLDSVKWARLPAKFEAGTPDIAGAIGLGAAADYLKSIGMENIREHEKMITKYALERIGELDVRIAGPLDAEKKGGLVAFSMKGVHPHDLAALLDAEGIAVRSGYHCAQPIHERLGFQATTRASFYLYNKKEEVDTLAEAVKKARKAFGV